MIHSFADELSKDIFHGIRSHAVRAHFPLSLVVVAERKLDLLNCVEDIEMLLMLPEHRHNRAGRDRRGKESIPLDDRWCILFRFTKNSVEDVEIKVA